MLLTIDVGNTHTVLGLFDGEDIVEHWRISTDARRTADEGGLARTELAGDRDDVAGTQQPGQPSRQRLRLFRGSRHNLQARNGV